MSRDLPLIAPQPVAEFTPEAYHDYVTGMYSLQGRGKVRVQPPAPGLSVSRTKSGGFTIRRTKARAFEYITMSELAALAKLHGCGQADLWNAFKKRNFIIAKDRITAEHINMKVNT